MHLVSQLNDRCGLMPLCAYDTLTQARQAAFELDLSLRMQFLACATDQKVAVTLLGTGSLLPVAPHQPEQLYSFERSASDLACDPAGIHPSFDRYLAFQSDMVRRENRMAAAGVRGCGFYDMGPAGPVRRTFDFRQEQLRRLFEDRARI